MIIAITILILGLIIGSFLNVLICRLPDIQSILKTRSHCPECKKQLAWNDLIPLISFIMLSRKCRYCGKQISWQYPIVELGTALLFLVLYLKFGLTLYTCYLLLVTCLLIVIFVYDQIRQIIPDEMVIGASVITLIYYLFNYKLYDFNSILIGMVIPVLLIGLIVFFTKGKGMGIGDIKLAGLLGLILGYPNIITALFLAFVIGAFYGLYLMAIGKKGMKDAVAFGPFLIIGFYITIFYGQEIMKWYLRI